MTAASGGGVDYAGIGVLIGAIGTFVTVVVGAIATLRGQDRIRAQVQHEHATTNAAVAEVQRNVDTLNETTAGKLAAAEETRRIEAIPHDLRTAREQRHVDESPPHDPPQGPRR